MSGGGQISLASYPWLAFILGVGLMAFWPAVWPQALIFSLLVGLASGFLLLAKTRPMGWLLVCFLLGLGRFIFAQDNFKKSSLPDICWGKSIIIRGELISRPRAKSFGGHSATLKRVSYDCGYGVRPFDLKVLVNSSAAWPIGAQSGQVWQIIGRVEPLPDGLVFSYRYYLFRQRIGLIIKAKDKQLIAQLKPSLWSYLQAQQQKLAQGLARSLPEPAASLAGPLVWGGDGELTGEWQQKLAATGLSHITAVSGFNISLLVLLIANSLLLISFPRRSAIVLTSLVITSYVLVIGAPASAVRAGLFGLLVLWGKESGRPSLDIHLLLISASLMLVVNPFYLWGDLGFGLSFLAVLGLIYWTSFWQKILGRYPLFRLKIIKENLASTLAAQVWTWPLIFWQFGQLSLIAPLANLLVVWSLPWLTISLLLASFFALFYPAAGVFIFAPAGWLLSFILKIIDLLASLPGASYLSDWPSNWRLMIVIIYYSLTVVLIKKILTKLD
ncbi:MAG TPA: ComEC/Rec2 family competence protein [bacterium]|nr:ComEC/Rec2 family competence protein [bacterium]